MKEAVSWKKDPHKAMCWGCAEENKGIKTKAKKVGSKAMWRKLKSHLLN